MPGVWIDDVYIKHVGAEVLEVVVRGEKLGARYLCASGNPEVVLAHISGTAGIALREDVDLHVRVKNSLAADVYGDEIVEGGLQSFELVGSSIITGSENPDFAMGHHR